MVPQDAGEDCGPGSAADGMMITFRFVKRSTIVTALAGIVTLVVSAITGIYCLDTNTNAFVFLFTRAVVAMDVWTVSPSQLS